MLDATPASREPNCKHLPRVELLEQSTLPLVHRIKLEKDAYVIDGTKKQTAGPGRMCPTNALENEIEAILYICVCVFSQVVTIRSMRLYGPSKT